VGYFFILLSYVYFLRIQLRRLCQPDYFINECEYLDPGEEHHDGQSRVEDHFPVAETLEVAVLVRVRQQILQNVVHLDRTVDVEGDAADRHDYDDDVQDVPEGLEVRQLVHLYLL